MKFESAGRLDSSLRLDSGCDNMCKASTVRLEWSLKKTHPSTSVSGLTDIDSQTGVESKKDPPSNIRQGIGVQRAHRYRLSGWESKKDPSFNTR
ncbi:hypothetical protein CDAR_368111 [Caerostris darwini]|uniref:Uncharacterized protein n=1 Tax=Caerostris darwini TaxID=1538125 RepID=A0AAV4UHV5_9ARAC|nr:hypothetical protein CDAR_368111 [Caerostris darwini]